MAIFWKRKLHIRAEKEADKQATMEVAKIYRIPHKKADEANREVQRVNRLLKADGITLKIIMSTKRSQNAS